MTLIFFGYNQMSGGRLVDGKKNSGSVGDVRGSDDGDTWITLYDKMIAREEYHLSLDSDDDGPRASPSPPAGRRRVACIYIRED